MAVLLGLWKVCLKQQSCCVNLGTNSLTNLIRTKTCRSWSVPSRENVSSGLHVGSVKIEASTPKTLGKLLSYLSQFAVCRPCDRICNQRSLLNTCRTDQISRFKKCLCHVEWSQNSIVCAMYSTKVPNGQRSGHSNQASDGPQGETNRSTSRLDHTRNIIKETSGKFKEKLEETMMRENIMTIPNMLCLTRILMSPFLGYLIFNNSFSLALGLFVFAGATDLLDGFIARNFKSQQSMFGSFLDPLADKLLVFTLVISLTGCNLIPVPLTSLIIARDVCLVGSGFYIRYVSLPPPRTILRYFDATLATAQLSPTFVSKVNTAVQLSLVAFTLASPIFGFENHPYLQILWYVTATTTVVSAFSYVFTKNSYFSAKKNK